MKNENLIMEGTVLEHRGRGGYQVEVKGTVITAKKSRELEKNHIIILPGDKVKLEVSPYDISHGLIKYRFK